MATEDAPPDDPPRADEPRADEPRADEPRADEPRAKDVVTRPRAELEEAMDPATLARLASWFDRPSAIVVAEQEAVDAEELEFREQLARRAQASAAVDPALVEAILRRQETLRRAVPPVVPPELTVDESILLPLVVSQLDRVSAEEPPSDELYFQQPSDVEQILAQHNAPQAILRDLFRPATDFELRMEPVFDEPPFDNAAGEARQAMRERQTPPWLTSFLPELTRARNESRAILTGSWPEHVAAVLLWHEAEAARRGEGR